MSALEKWRLKVRHLPKEERERDLRRSCNADAFNELKAKRAEQQRKRRAKMKVNRPINNKRASRVSVSTARKNRLRRMQVRRDRKKPAKITLGNIGPRSKCVQFVHLNKAEDRGVKEFVFFVDVRFFEKIGVKIQNKLYTEGDGSAQKLMLSMINNSTKDLFKAPNRSVESYVKRGKNTNERMDYAFFLLFNFLVGKPYVTGHVDDGFDPKFPRNVVATVISQGGTVF